MFRGELVGATYMSADLNATQTIWPSPKVHKPSEQESRNCQHMFTAPGRSTPVYRGVNGGPPLPHQAAVI